MRLGAVNCDEEKSLCGQYGVQGYPTLKFFKPGRRTPDEYPGERDAPAMVAFGLEQWAKVAPPPEVRLSAFVSLKEVAPALYRFQKGLRAISDQLRGFATRCAITYGAA